MSRFTQELTTFNGSGALDLWVDQATSERVTLIACVDGPESPRCKLIFTDPAYLQLPWHFGFQELEAHRIEEAFPEVRTRDAHEPLPPQSPSSSQLPSLALDELHSLSIDRYTLFVFGRAPCATPQPPPSYVIAMSVAVEVAGRG